MEKRWTMKLRLLRYSGLYRVCTSCSIGMTMHNGNYYVSQGLGCMGLDIIFGMENRMEPYTLNPQPSEPLLFGDFFAKFLTIRGPRHFVITPDALPTEP